MLPSNSFIADLHIHSPLSRATSRRGWLPQLNAWAAIKGIQVVGTGDFTHPEWLEHLREHLSPAEPGLFRLREGRAAPVPDIPQPAGPEPRFLLTAEISNIYRKHGRLRKIHNLLLVPDFASVERMNAALGRVGNLQADGRPMLGLDARDLLEMLLENAPEGFLVPAHIWTPWFSLFGSRSGFDCLEDCFEDLSEHVFALETGLSSDPPMNRLISALDRFTLLANSDSHSPGKLGREANIFDCEPSFFAMREAIRTPDKGLLGTVGLFPQAGKYYLDGHRQCGLSLEPAQTRKYGGICPTCGKPLTVGVLHRVLELADREQPCFPEAAPAFFSQIPLPEILAERLGCGENTKKVRTTHARLIQLFGSEFNLLWREAPEEIARRHSDWLAEAIRRLRAGEVRREPGYDGQYGHIRLF